MKVRTKNDWPAFRVAEDVKGLQMVIRGIGEWAKRLLLSLDARDRKLSEAINAADIQIVTSAPSGAPDSPEPVIQLFKNGSDWELHVYTGAADGWKTVTLS